MTAFREVIVDGKTEGFVEDSPQGREVADRFLDEHVRVIGQHRPVGGLIPQGARRLDR